MVGFWPPSRLGRLARLQRVRAGCVGFAGGVEHRPEPQGTCHASAAEPRRGSLHGASPILLPPRSAGWAPHETPCPARPRAPGSFHLPAHLNPALKAALLAQGFADMPRSRPSASLVLRGFVLLWQGAALIINSCCKQIQSLFSPSLPVTLYCQLSLPEIQPG